jgi:hypothetical protein
MKSGGIGGSQPDCQHQQTDIGANTQCREHTNHIPTRPELPPMQPILSNLAEELFVALLPSEQTRTQNPGPVHGEQRTDTVEFTGEDLENYQSEGELRECRADVGSFKGALCCTNLDEFVRGEDDGAGAVEAEGVVIVWVAALCVVCELVGGMLQYIASHLSILRIQRAGFGWVGTYFKHGV